MARGLAGRSRRGFFKERAERFKHFDGGDVGAVVHKLGIGLRRIRPTPGVGESVELRLAGFAGSLAEQDVVLRVGIERWVELN